MKLLKCEDNQGHFYKSEGEFVTIDKITKDDLLRLVELTLDEDAVQFDEYNADVIKNHAQQIIYKSVFEKLRDLKQRKKEFKDESDRLYLKEYTRYRDSALEN